jgi:hypothetical protein
MPPRFAYWTIILEGKPTAFRAQYRDELLPTFKQLQTKHPDVVMKWFSRGKLWASPEEAQSASQRRTTSERRKPDWRPGGEHRDPRARFDIPRDEKRRRFAAKLRRDARDTTSPTAEGKARPERPERQREFPRPEWKPRPAPGRKPVDERDRGGPGKPRPEWRPKSSPSNKGRFGRPADRRGGRKPGGGNRGGGGQR